MHNVYPNAGILMVENQKIHAESMLSLEGYILEPQGA
jgi:hypothetical protein